MKVATSSEPVPTVSVIVPVYNGERFLRQALDSIYAQCDAQCDAPPEVIVVDDGSTDSSPSIVAEYPEVQYIRQPNAGVAAARNTGLAHSTGKFVAFLDQDDLWTPDKLEVQIGYMLEHPEVGVVYARNSVALEEGAGWPPWLNPKLEQSNFETGQVGWLLSAAVARRWVFDMVGNFDVSYRAASDSDWCMRVKDAGISITYMPEILLLYRVHGENESYNLDMLQREFFSALHRSITRRQARRRETENGIRQV